MTSAPDVNWSTWRAPDAVRGAQLSGQLAKEIGAAHDLFDLKDVLTIIAADGASDDVLGITPCGTVLYVIHLTWSQTPDPMGDFPMIQYLDASDLPKGVQPFL
ncbi:MAG: hypothetical protein AAF386_00015 [Pseudomonadota bacterium]